MLEYEAYCQEIVGKTHDHKEGVQAFLEKRKPNFVGK
jgi:2-(1,2-epoxy-1,2-dihydrophenyl)acetyl-CoA isomerase